MGYMMDFLENFIYFFIENSIEIIKVIIIFITFFGIKATFTRKSIIFSSIVIVVFSIMWTLEKDNFVLLLLYILFLTLEIYILFSEFKFKELLLKEVWIILFTNIIDAMVYNSATSILEYFNFENIILMKFFGSISVLAFLFIIGRFIKEKAKFVLKLSTKFYIIYLFVGFADYVMLSTIFLILKETDKRVLFVCVTVSFSILLQYSLILLMTIANEGLKFQHYLSQKYLRVQQENYEYLEYREEETKKFRHDYKNHLNSLHILCKEKRFDDVEKYINEISDRLNEYNIYISVGNSFIDAILNYYLQKMEKLDVKFIVSGKMPNNCYITMFDLCTIISNLLDNALDAIDKLEQKDKWIEVTFRYDSLMIYCNVTNPYNGELNIYKNKIMSKKSSKNHGYGLGNIKKSVELYSGSMDIKVENKIFKVLIALVNKEKLDIN